MLLSPRGSEPIAVSPNGQRYFAAVEAASRSGVVEVSLSTGKVRRIEKFASPIKNSADGQTSTTPEVTIDELSFDGRWLVWTQQRQLAAGTATTTVMAWDSASGDLWSIAGPLSDSLILVEGQAKASGLIAWGEYPKGSSRPIHFQLYSLRTRHSTAVLEAPHATQGGAAFFWQRTLLFDVVGSSAAEAKWHLEATAVSTVKPVAVPAELRDLRGDFTFRASSDYVVAYQQRGGSKGSKPRPAHFTTRVLRRGSARPLKLTNFTAMLVVPGSPFGDYLTWQEWTTSSGPSMFVGDLVSGAYAKFPGPGKSGRDVLAALGGGSTLLAEGPLGSMGYPFAVLHLNRLTSLGNCGG